MKISTFFKIICIQILESVPYFWWYVPKVVSPCTTNSLVSIIFPGGSIFSKVSSVGDVGSPRFSEGVHYLKMDLTPYTDLVHENGPKLIL